MWLASPGGKDKQVSREVFVDGPTLVYLSLHLGVDSGILQVVGVGRVDVTQVVSPRCTGTFNVGKKMNEH